jgi:CubicO group peptidase (beta-lactamase class C family)
MYDPYVSHEMTIRDLLTHRSGMGLGEGDLLFFPPSDYTSSEIIRRVRYMKPASSFRSGFVYDNLFYIAAGEIVPAITGKTWNQTIGERIFKPLNMNDSNTSIAEFHPGTNFATPHSLVEGKLTAISLTSIDSAAPAGAINSSAADMAKWLIAQLDGGAIRGTDQRLFSDACHREMWSAQTAISVEEPPPGLAAARTNFAAYGLGWFLSDYRGRKEVSHMGGVPGYVSRVTMIPDLKLGVVVLTNQESGMMFDAVTYRVLDRYMDAPDYDWVKAGKDVIAKERADAAVAEKKQSDARPPDSKPSLPLEKYPGNYEDAWYGGIAIAMEQGKLVMRFSHTPALTGDMEHWQYDTFKVKWRDRSLAADAFASFWLNAEGEITEVKMKPVSPLTDFSFDFQDLTIVPVKRK